MLEGLDEAAMEDRRASFYRGQAHDGRLAVILGAGNIAAIPTMDVATKLFNEARCVF